MNQVHAEVDVIVCPVPRSLTIFSDFYLAIDFYAQRKSTEERESGKKHSKHSIAYCTERLRLGSAHSSRRERERVVAAKELTEYTSEAAMR